MTISYPGFSITPCILLPAEPAHIHMLRKAPGTLVVLPPPPPPPNWRTLNAAAIPRATAVPRNRLDDVTRVILISPFVVGVSHGSQQRRWWARAVPFRELHTHTRPTTRMPRLPACPLTAHPPPRPPPPPTGLFHHPPHALPPAACSHCRLDTTHAHT